MSVVQNSTYGSPTQPLWTSTSSTFTGSFSEAFQLNTLGPVPVTWTSGVPILVSSVTFPVAVTKDMVVNGWLKITNTYSTTLTGSIYITSDSGGATTNSRQYTYTLLVGDNYLNLDGLDCVPSGNTIYLFLMPSSTPGGSATLSFLTGNFAQIPYSLLPTNNGWQLYRGYYEALTTTGI